VPRASGEGAPPGQERPRLGISTCLLGENVRYNGGHARDRFLTDTFGKFVEWVPVCPEVECGLPVPRESMHLEGDPTNPRLVTSRAGIDHTSSMRRWAAGRVKELESQGLVGYIFKANSPSSGMERVKVFDDGGVPRKIGVGLWARAFMDHFPLLPVEEDGRLHDPDLRENFVERVFCLMRYRNTVGAKRSRGSLVVFHAAHKLQLMAHSPKLLKEMGSLVAHAKEQKPTELYARYEEILTQALRLKATAGKNANVLQHALGYFKKSLTPDEKAEMLRVIEEYRGGFVPLIVPVTLLGHYVRKYREPYLAEQSYLAPHPSELRLRNHA
jgi:uncharacterized protein YbgA (DUF1722 family)/uncharacterized protein YbbK (DUF523 family)